MSRLHRRLKFLRDDLLEVAAFALAVRILLDRSGFLSLLFSVRTLGLNAGDERRGSKRYVVSDPQVPIDPS